MVFFAVLSWRRWLASCQTRRTCPTRRYWRTARELLWKARLRRVPRGCCPSCVFCDLRWEASLLYLRGCGYCQAHCFLCYLHQSSRGLRKSRFRPECCPVRRVRLSAARKKGKLLVFGDGDGLFSNKSCYCNECHKKKVNSSMKY